MAKKTALLGMLVALAFVLSYIETLIPINLGIPGAKLGLANLVVMVALYTLGTKEAFALSMVRILLTGLTFSSMAAMLYSFAGGLLSFAVMYLAKRSKLFSAAGVSVLNCRDRRDAIIIFCIDRGCSLQKVNEELYRFGEETVS